MPSCRVASPNRFFRVGRAIDAQGGTGPMAVKPAEGTVSQVCRVCGGEVNPHGECVVCGTKQSDPPKADDKGSTTWLKGDSDGGLNAWIGASVSGGDSKDDALRKWLAGEDTAFQDWIGVPTTAGGAKASRTPAERVSDDKVRELRTKALEVDGLHAELEAMRSTLNRELVNFRQGKFDPVKYIEETANLSKQLQTEIAKRRELEQDIEHIKKGSIAVIKYVKTQQLKAGASPELKKRLDQETKARQTLEADVGEQWSVNEQLRKQLESGLGKMKPDQREVKKRELDLVEREATFKAKEERLASMPAGEGGAPSEELKRRFEEELREMAEDYLAKEEEFKKRIIGLEQEVGKYKIEDKVRAEAKAFEGKPKSEVQAAFSRKEQEVLHKEKMVLMREQELQRLQADLQVKEDEIKKVKEPLTYKEEELLRREKDLQVEVKQQKVKMGIPRLDDLLFGGIPFGTNASVYGPAYVGKEVLVSLFMAEGLKKGVPVLWILTDKGPTEVREEMAFALPGYEEYEKLGLVQYIDTYSKSMGAEASDPNTTYIDEPTDYQSILKAVDARAAEWKKKYPTYRLAFRSVSTLIAYLDPTTTFKFLQPFVGRRKRDKAVAFYVIEKGMHEEQEIQMLGSLMDGSIEFKVEQLKSFLCIKGICDVQSRGWIRYTYTKSSLSIGSFSLDHIK